jgi:negative regulator of flagellin synthesis FlgM
MKVSNKLPNPMQSAEAAKSAKSSGADALDGKKNAKDSVASAFDTADSSRVEVSSRARDINKARELATPGDSIDEAKVARLQALIDSGKYKVNAEAVADRLLDEHSKMPSGFTE